MPPIIPLDDVLLDHGTFHESLTSSKMLQLPPTQYSSINHGPSAERNTLILWYFRGEFSQLSHYIREDIGRVRRTIPLCRICLLPASSLIWNPVGSLRCAHPPAPGRPLCASLAKHPADCLSQSSLLQQLLQMVECLSHSSAPGQSLTGGRQGASVSRGELWRVL